MATIRLFPDGEEVVLFEADEPVDLGEPTDLFYPAPVAVRGPRPTAEPVTRILKWRSTIG